MGGPPSPPPPPAPPLATALNTLLQQPKSRNGGEEPFRLERPYSRSLKTNVLKQKFSMTYIQNKAETTYLYWSLLAISP